MKGRPSADSVLDELLRLAIAGTPATFGGYFIGTDAPLERTVGIPVEAPWTPHEFANIPVPQILTSETGATIVVPISGSSGEPGWVAVCASGASSFSVSDVETVGSVAALVEDRLDRSIEHDRIDSLSDALRTHQEQLQLMQERLAISNQELEQFAYIAAHELVAPLRSVTIYADLLADVLPSGADGESAVRVQSCAKEIRAGVNLMQQQIRFLLDLSKLQSDPAQSELVDLGHIARLAEDTLSSGLDEVGASVQIGGLPTVIGRTVPLQSVFANLISNSIRYRSDERPLRITIDAVVDGDHALVRVADNGVGVDAEAHRRVFKLFERNTDAPGSGIGLAVSRRILETFGASIELAADVDEGATILMRFPSPGPLPLS